MKVKELISKLEMIDSNLEVLCYMDDAPKELGDNKFFQIDALKVADATTERGDDGVATLAFRKGPDSRKLAFIDITCDI